MQFPVPIARILQSAGPLIQINARMSQDNHVTVAGSSNGRTYGQSAKLSIGRDRPLLSRAATRLRQAPGASPVCLRKKRLK